jgi:hypothetical protein
LTKLSGIAYIINSMNTDTAILGDMFEWADGNPNKEDRVGWTVTVNDTGRISRANNDSQSIIGVVAGGDDAVTLVANTWMNEWHAKHVRDWAGRIEYERQDLITWVENGRREMHELDRLPPGLVIPEHAETWTHWPETGERLERPKLNLKFNDGTQGPFPYVGRLKRHEWAVVVLLGKVPILNNEQVDKRWVCLGKSLGAGAKLWLVR